MTRVDACAPGMTAQHSIIPMSLHFPARFTGMLPPKANPKRNNTNGRFARGGNSWRPRHPPTIARRACSRDEFVRRSPSIPTRWRELTGKA